MYASLITAGASALYDLYKSATSKTGSTDAASASTQSSASTDASTIGATASTSTSTSTSTSGSKFSDALNKLFTDLQASTTSSTDTTGTVANDLQSLSKGLHAGGAHGHHHGAKPTSDDQSASTGDPSSSNPFQGLASSLVAYAKTQSLGASTSTSLTA